MNIVTVVLEIKKNRISREKVQTVCNVPGSWNTFQIIKIYSLCSLITNSKGIVYALKLYFSLHLYRILFRTLVSLTSRKIQSSSVPQNNGILQILGSWFRASYFNIYRYIQRDTAILSWFLFQDLYMFREFTMPIISIRVLQR
jgi:hypothetical protein